MLKINMVYVLPLFLDVMHFNGLLLIIAKMEFHALPSVKARGFVFIFDLFIRSEAHLDIAGSTLILSGVSLLSLVIFLSLPGLHGCELLLSQILVVWLEKVPLLWIVQVVFPLLDSFPFFLGFVPHGDLFGSLYLHFNL